MVDSPIILMCSERSGSNLISRIFDAHHEICAPAPAHLWRIYGRNAHKYRVGDEVAFADDFSSLLQHTLNPWQISKKKAYDILVKSRRGDFVKALAELYYAEVRLNQKNILFLKENRIYKYISLFLKQYDSPRFILMHRDPRDVVSSWILSPVLRGGLIRATDTWLQDQEEYIRLASILKLSFNVSIVGYEQLLLDPHGTLKQICGEIDLEYDHGMLNYHAGKGAQVHAQSSVDWRNTSNPIMKDNCNKYLKTLRSGQLAYVEKRCGALMQVFGYKTVGPQMSEKEFSDLEKRLRLEEPWDKEAYQKVGKKERVTRAEWGKALRKIEERTATLSS
ncbi:sulfotransferase [uncultured Pseudodesulfovibrio sp.]|uniref:sulfotransferase n=1 Tax=uncultured Pseudodesulfovibrio sp. TaxID=2035858 RepID=UPI0029C83746|nr:sulfotransferase [uncultured Pseudodesulfovibrio sp.]